MRGGGGERTGPSFPQGARRDLAPVEDCLLLADVLEQQRPQPHVQRRRLREGKQAV